MRSVSSCAGSVTSQVVARARPPDRSIRSASASSRSVRLAASTTRAPRSANAIAVASPIPDEAPVTTTTAPWTSRTHPPRYDGWEAMDVIEAHASRLPALDERWEPRAHPREELERALVAGGVAGPAGHPHHNVFGNIRKLVDHDPDKRFGLSSMPEPVDCADVVRLVGDAAGVAVDALATEGPPHTDAWALPDSW